jgi:hypothetical protein
MFGTKFYWLEIVDLFRVEKHESGNHFPFMDLG